MDKKKRKRLEAKGWKFGSAADFLGLSAEDSTYIEFRLRLVDAIKERRKEKFSQVEFAKAIGSSQSRVAKMEANDPSVSMDLLIKGLVSLGVTVPEFGKILGEKKPTTISPKAGTHNVRQPRMLHLDLSSAKSSPPPVAARATVGRTVTRSKVAAKKK